jgi:hypothetical protein
LLSAADGWVMRKPIVLPRPKLAWVRSAFSIVALAAVLVVAVRLAIGAPATPPGLAEELSGRQDPPVKQSAAAACFKTSPAVSAVRSAGATVLVRFLGEPGFMKLTFFPSADGAIHYSYAHGSLPSFYSNTVWSDVPSRLTTGDYDALSACLPVPKASS